MSRLRRVDDVVAKAVMANYKWYCNHIGAQPAQPTGEMLIDNDNVVTLENINGILGRYRVEFEGDRIHVSSYR